MLHVRSLVVQRSFTHRVVSFVREFRREGMDRRVITTSRQESVSIGVVDAKTIQNARPRH